MDDLDRIDRSLLRLLQEDGRRTTLDLARRVGLSPTGASQRIKRLFSEGFIRAVRAVLDPARIGKAQLVFIEVRLDHTAPHVFDRFAEAVLRAPEIIECHMVVGGFDYLVKAASPTWQCSRISCSGSSCRCPGSGKHTLTLRSPM